MAPTWAGPGLFLYIFLSFGVRAFRPMQFQSLLFHPIELQPLPFQNCYIIILQGFHFQTFLNSNVLIFTPVLIRFGFFIITYQ